MAKREPLSLWQLPHPLRSDAALPRHAASMERFLGPKGWKSLVEGLADDTVHTGTVVDRLVNQEGLGALAEYIRMTCGMGAGTELGNAYAGLIALRQALYPQPHFLLEDDLARLLERTDLAPDVPMSMLALPYPRFYIEFGRARALELYIPNPVSGQHALEGAYIETGYHPVLGSGIYVMVTGSPLGKSGPLDDATHGMFLTRQDPDMSLKAALEHSFRSAAELVKGSPYQASPAAYVTPLFECLLYLAKALLYVGLPEARRELRPARSQWDKAHAGLKSSAKRAKAQRQAALLSDHILVTAPPAPETTVPNESGEPARTVATHWRRGHYRMQAHGPRHGERKLVFIRPILVHGDRGTSPPPASRHYVVR